MTLIILIVLLASCSRTSPGTTADSYDIEAFEIYPWLYSIYENRNNVFAYLIVGDDYALLFDTTSGFGLLHYVIKEITDLPVIVVLGHGHYDHAGGVSMMTEFFSSEIWLHEADFPVYQRYIKETRNLNSLDIGRVFDLGGLNVEIIGMEGHTAGSVGALVREHRILFTSDSAGPDIWLFLGESLPVSQYIAMLELTMQLDFDTFFIGHNDVPMPKTDFQKYINVARNTSLEMAHPYRELGSGMMAFRYDEDGASIYFSASINEYNRLQHNSLPAGNLGSIQVELRDNFYYGNGYQALLRYPNLLGGYRLRRGDVFTLKATYIASRDLENELLVGFVDMSRRWRTLSYTQKNIEPPNVVLGPASKAGEEVTSEVTITLVANANDSGILANTLVLETLGRGRHGSANSGLEGPVTINFTEFILTKH
ncbi:MAG: MBL fold metallo-hydrolase [Treponema sp.]|nr:MBL fold metallo-hydrolase [Treponema sp.]